MTAIAANPVDQIATAAPVDHVWRRVLRSGRIVVGGGMLIAIVLMSLVTLPWTLNRDRDFYFNRQDSTLARLGPTANTIAGWWGYDNLGRSIFGRCVLGGACSLLIGFAAAGLSVVMGVAIGLIAGYRGGWLDSLLMRIVDILYGLPYILMVILLKIALERPLTVLLGGQAANFVVLFVAIGAVSWLTMARVIRGQVLSLRSQPFIEACKAGGLKEWRIFTHHLLPNLIGPITVYTTLVIPGAILNESFLSFLGIGIQPPMPTWGSLASDGLLPALNPVNHRWWMLLFPCALLAITLLALNFMGDGLRDVFDPKRESAKI